MIIEQSKIIKSIVCSLVLLNISISVFAQDFGVLGEIYEIEEDDLLQFITDKLKHMDQTGALLEVQRDIQRKVQYKLAHPQPLESITKTKSLYQYKYDPTITVSRDVPDNRGGFIAKAGDKFNPLKQFDMPPMLFIDGTDQKQVEWALNKIRDKLVPRHNEAKIVLVKGSPFDLGKQIKRDVFFDQRGLITTKLGIKHVPTIVFHVKPELQLTVREEVVQ